MVNLLPIIALGFFLGMRRACDPDHVIAVTTIVARNRKLSHAAWIGAFWGLGHTLTILLVGSGIILFGWVIPARIGLSMEFSVGLMLILLGILNLTRILNWITVGLKGSVRTADLGAGSVSHDQDAHAHVHTHLHMHGDYIHTHAHQHDPESHPHAASQTPLGWIDRHFGSIGVYQFVRPLVVGLVHGLAGSAAVALLVLTTIRNTKLAVLYLLVFGVGTIAGMMLITGAMAVPFAAADKRLDKFNWWLRVASGAISVAFGLFVVYHIGIVNGLFTAHPHWTPE